ncbi:MAG: DUF1659 domain-containing protein [Firmicutes bacterium]|nr:DUF1659 domain-containing protein [Dethiobacter sp.]MBS3887907.1 DUF1659 domain-containing protein [Bacillota bacterium]MBS4054253.1 DUF1659 domain-containing protein [Thermaerobacter sp.]
MAIRENLLSRLRITVQVGQDLEGAAILRHRAYNRLRDSVSDTDVAAIAAVLASLQKHPVLFVHRIDEARVIG